ncbi:MAG: ABC-2 transporter permease [Tetragenococcus koreensis]|nr:ABC-2 transporter permease [Tetragenococcus koreensis]
MLNLIRKDLIIQKKQLLMLLPLIAIFAIFGESFSPIFIFSIISVFIPMNAYIYDEQAGADFLLNSLPYTRKEIVAARYLGSIFYIPVTIAITAGVLYLLQFHFTFKEALIAAMLSLLTVSIFFPLLYLIKPGYIGVAVIIGFVAGVILIPRLANFFSEYLVELNELLASLTQVTLYTVSAALLLLIYLFSWGASTIVYQRKKF